MYIDCVDCTSITLKGPAHPPQYEYNTFVYTPAQY